MNVWTNGVLGDACVPVRPGVLRASRVTASVGARIACHRRGPTGATVPLTATRTRFTCLRRTRTEACRNTPRLLRFTPRYMSLWCCLLHELDGPCFHCMCAISFSALHEQHSKLFRTDSHLTGQETCRFSLLRFYCKPFVVCTPMVVISVLWLKVCGQSASELLLSLWFAGVLYVFGLFKRFVRGFVALWMFSRCIFVWYSSLVCSKLSFWKGNHAKKRNENGSVTSVCFDKNTPILLHTECTGEKFQEPQDSVFSGNFAFTQKRTCTRFLVLPFSPVWNATIFSGVGPAPGRQELSGGARAVLPRAGQRRRRARRRRGDAQRRQKLHSGEASETFEFSISQGISCLCGIVQWAWRRRDVGQHLLTSLSFPSAGAHSGRVAISLNEFVVFEDQFLELEYSDCDNVNGRCAGSTQEFSFGATIAPKGYFGSGDSSCDFGDWTTSEWSCSAWQCQSCSHWQPSASGFWKQIGVWTFSGTVVPDYLFTTSAR